MNFLIIFWFKFITVYQRYHLNSMFNFGEICWKVKTFVKSKTVCVFENLFEINSIKDWMRCVCLFLPQSWKEIWLIFTTKWFEWKESFLKTLLTRWDEFQKGFDFSIKIKDFDDFEMRLFIFTTKLSWKKVFLVASTTNHFNQFSYHFLIIFLIKIYSFLWKLMWNLV